MAEQYENEVALIRYHTWWPYDGDPFYQFAIVENRARVDYYEINFVTYLMVDGILQGGDQIEIWDSLLVSRMDVESPLEIDISGTYDSEQRAGDIEITVVATADIDSDGLRFQCVITESDIYWQAPNGLEWHNQTMRDMIPGAGGEQFDIQNGDTLDFSREFVLHDLLVDANCEIVVFVQDNETKEILQAAELGISDLEQTGIADATRPSEFRLFDAFPNPFNAQTAIHYIIPDEGFVEIEIYNVLGQRVDRIVNENQQAGYHQIIWTAERLPSGVYFYKLRIGNLGETRKMTLLK